MPGRSFNVNETRKNHRNSANVFIYRCVFFSFIFKTINVNVDYCAIQINWPFRGCFSTVWLWCKNTIKSGNKQVFFSRFEFSWYLTNYIQNKHAIFQSINVKFVRLQVSNWNHIRLFKSICCGKSSNRRKWTSDGILVNIISTWMNFWRENSVLKLFVFILVARH